MSPICEIYDVPRKRGHCWKWRHRDAAGATIEGEGEYDLFFDCVEAARARGFSPVSRWTGAVALCSK